MYTQDQLKADITLDVSFIIFILVQFVKTTKSTISIYIIIYKNIDKG